MNFILQRLEVFCIKAKFCDVNKSLSSIDYQMVYEKPLETSDVSNQLEKE